MESVLKFVYISLQLLLLTPVIFAQNNINYNIQGDIITLNKEPVSNASIIFINQKDTTNKFFSKTDSAGNFHLSLITSIKNETPSIPHTIELAQNYPNPFLTETNIVYKLNKEADISIKIFDIIGQEIKKFSIGFIKTGIHSLLWDGKDNFGNKVSSGVYLYQLNSENERLVKKMLYKSGANESRSTSGNTSAFKMELAEPFPLNKNLSKSSSQEGSTYTIQIRNNYNTGPEIFDKDIQNIVIRNDTTLNITVEKTNLAANAGHDQEVKVGQYTMLDGSGSTRGDGDTLTYHWVDDPANPAHQRAFWDYYSTSPLGYTKGGIYRYWLTVNNGLAESNTDTVIINVKPRDQLIFADPALEAMVRYSLKNQNGALNHTILLGIDSLQSFGAFDYITSLQGIDQCANLRYLGMGLQHLYDITPLASLNMLTELYLDQNRNISDILPLAGLTELQKLDLGSNNISDVTPLRNLTKLTALHMTYNPVTDISALSGMTELNELWFSMANLSGTSVISEFTKLRYLWLADCKISDVSFVSGLNQLIGLMLGGNNLADISPIANCTKLIRLQMDKNQITNITPIQYLINLNVLDLMLNKITNIKPLIDNPGIGQGDVVVLTGNPLDSISVNQYIPELKSRGVLVIGP